MATAWTVTWLGVCTLALVACNKEPQPSEPAPAATPVAVQQAATATAATPAAAAASAAASDCSKLEIKDSFDEEAYSLRVEGAPSYAAGKQGTVDVTLKAKAGYHANDQYPYKLKLTPCAGVQYAEEVVRGDAVKITHEQAKLQVAFVPNDPGERVFAGTFSFSVCSDEHCLVEKRDIGLRLKVQ